MPVPKAKGAQPEVLGDSVLPAKCAPSVAAPAYLAAAAAVLGGCRAERKE